MPKSTSATSVRGVVSVRLRLLGSFTLLLALMGALVAVSVMAVNNLQSAQREVSGKAVPHLAGLSDAALAAKSAANDERGFLLTKDDKFVKEAVERRELQQAGLAKARTSAANSAEAAAVDAIAAELTTFNGYLDEEFALHATDPAAALKLSTGRNRDQRKVYEAKFAEAIKLANEQVATSTAANDRLASRSRTLLWVSLAVIVAVGGLVAWLLARSVTRPLAAAVDVLETAAAGDLTRRAQVVGPTEFRRMAEATNTMLTATAQTVRTIATSASALVTTAGDVAKASEEIAATAQGTSVKADTVSASAAQVSSGVRTVSVAAEEMGTTIGGIASSVSQVSAVAAEAVASADAARQAVTQLDTSSHQIGTVVKLITSIAEQTNLLALNATIEAARAGDAGKGFAVVAGEVKDLAQETAKATEDIATQVGAIQNDIRHAVDAIGRISEVIASINEHQGAIATTVEEQSATANEMTRSIHEIFAGADDITNKISDMANTATTTASTIQQTRQSAATLSGMAGDLQRLVDQFDYR